MNLIEKVEKAINDIGLPFIHFDLLRANNILDITETPCVVYLRNPNSQIINAAGNYCEQTDFLLIFVEQTVENPISSEIEKVIEQMKDKAVKFIRHIRKGNELMIIRADRLQKVYEYMDLNVAGCGLSATIRETKGNCQTLKEYAGCHCTNS